MFLSLPIMGVLNQKRNCDCTLKNTGKGQKTGGFLTSGSFRSSMYNPNFFSDPIFHKNLFYIRQPNVPIGFCGEAGDLSTDHFYQVIRAPKQFRMLPRFVEPRV